MPSDYFVTLARYNAWANRRLYRACGRLSESEYLRDRLPAFGSIHAPLNLTGSGSPESRAGPRRASTLNRFSTPI